MEYLDAAVLDQEGSNGCPCQIPGKCPCVRCEPEKRTPRRSRRSSEYVQSEDSELDSTSSSRSVRITKCSPPNANRHPYQRPKAHYYSDSDSDVEHQGYGYNPIGAMRERAADAPGQHDRVHSRGREKSGLVRVRNTGQGINALTGQPFRQPSESVNLVSPPRMMQLDDEDEAYGSGRMRNVRKVQRGQAAAPGLVGGMDQLYMTSQQLATMKASRPLPEFPEDTHEIGDWRLKSDHAWKIHSMGMPESNTWISWGKSYPHVCTSTCRTWCCVERRVYP